MSETHLQDSLFLSLTDRPVEACYLIFPYIRHLMMFYKRKTLVEVPAFASNRQEPSNISAAAKQNVYPFPLNVIIRHSCGLTKHEYIQPRDYVTH